MTIAEVIIGTALWEHIIKKIKATTVYKGVNFPHTAIVRQG